jgi:restriction endonuclease S subunit
LEGLEVKEVMLKNVVKDNFEFRIDSDFFKKEMLSIIEFLRNKPHDRLKELVSDIKSFGAYSLCNEINFVEKKERAIPFIRCLNIKNGVVNFDDLLFIDKKSNNLLWKSEIKPQMVLVTMSGTVGNTTVALEHWEYPINSNQDIAKIETKKVNPYFLATFLNSKYGYAQMIRLQAGAVQQHLYLSQIEKIMIPQVSDGFQNNIESIVKSAHLKHELSQSLYHQAEELLLKTIGLKNFKPSTKGTNIKSFKESFGATGRLDAEYYQPKYEEIISKIKKRPYEVLDNLVTIKKSIEPGSDVYTDEGLPFIRVSDYNKFGISTPEKCLSDGFCKNNAVLLQMLYPTKETILFSKDGSVGAAYMLRENMQAVTSSAILHLTVKDKNYILPEYLTLVLNSEVVKQQAERDAGGSIILHWQISEIENVVVPIVDYKIQQQIASLVEESFTCREESERLLVEAREMVEREIESVKEK